jgi:two-component system, cell cycle sensor histidine kinase and response regulator CckA
LRLANSLQLQLFDENIRFEQIERALRAELINQEQAGNILRRSFQTIEERAAIATARSTLLTEQLQFQSTQQVLTELALEVSQQGIADFIEYAPIGIHLVDRDGIVGWVNQAEIKMLGYDILEYLGKPLIDFHVDRAAVTTSFDRLQRNEPVRAFETRMWRKDGSICYVSIDANPLFKDGKFIHARCFTRDITAQKLAEQKIRSQADLLNITTDAIIVCDLDGQIKFWNNGAEHIYGWQAVEVIGRNISELRHRDIAAETAIAFELVCIEGSWQGELEKKTKMDKKAMVFSRWSLVRDEDGNPKSILSVDTDITTKKLLELQFLRAQRLESLGTLATGIAHDLNNVLTPILGVAQLLPLTLPDLDDRNQRLLTMLVESSKRGSNLVKQILSFASGVDGERTVLQVRHILTEIVSISRQTFPKSIEISLSLLTEDLWTIWADMTQIHQILMNLFVNARDAMPTGGSIVTTVENLTLAEIDDSLHPNVIPGSYLSIAITDTGMGMDDETIERIFDPFFTTKVTGTGLGLSTTLSIVKSHGGFINVCSKIGAETTFRIYLPAIVNDAVAEPIAAKQLFDGHGRLVLVVDDECSIRSIVTVSLEKHNYRVMSASDGIEAIAVYAQNCDRIAIVLLDMMMPNLDSVHIIQIFQRLNPLVKIVAISGSAANRSIVEQFDLGGFLSKPFTPTEMLSIFANLSR